MRRRRKRKKRRRGGSGGGGGRVNKSISFHHLLIFILNHNWDDSIYRTAAGLVNLLILFGGRGVRSYFDRTIKYIDLAKIYMFQIFFHACIFFISSVQLLYFFLCVQRRKEMASVQANSNLGRLFDKTHYSYTISAHI